MNLNPFLLLLYFDQSFLICPILSFCYSMGNIHFEITVSQNSYLGPTFNFLQLSIELMCYLQDSDGHENLSDPRPNQ